MQVGPCARTLAMTGQLWGRHVMPVSIPAGVWVFSLRGACIAGVSCIMSEGRHTSVPVPVVRFELPLDHHTWLNQAWTKLSTFFRHLYANGFVNVYDNGRFIILILCRILSIVYGVFSCTRFWRAALTDCHYTHKFAIISLMLMLVAMVWIELGTVWILPCQSQINLDGVLERTQY
jgi:hypothetical protein